MSLDGMGIFYYILWLCAAVYVLALLRLAQGLRRLTPPKPASAYPFVSVIVPARNEEQNIEACLQRLTTQSYPQERYEIIVVDDGSTDRTAELIARFPSVQLLTSAGAEALAPKKAALHTGIVAARGEIILTTDADCLVPFRWIETMAGAFEPDVAAAASWLTVDRRPHLLGRIEQLDSFGLVLLGAAAFGLGRPFLANGANLGYRKSVYMEIGGFESIGRFASGDDDLLLQKIARQTSWRCLFVDGDEPVITHANAAWRGFWQQRLRWASKAAAYPKAAVLAEAGLYLFFVMLLVSLIAAPLLSPWLILPFWAKATADFLFLRRHAVRMSIAVDLPTFLSAELIQLIYILGVGLWANLGRYQWKGRSYRRGRMDVA